MEYGKYWSVTNVKVIVPECTIAYLSKVYLKSGGTGSCLPQQILKARNFVVGALQGLPAPPVIVS